MGRICSRWLPALAAACALAFGSAGAAFAGEAVMRDDPGGDIGLASVDIRRVEAGVLPPGHPLTPPGTGGTVVWVHRFVAGDWPPVPGLFSTVASYSRVVDDPDEPGQTLHVSGFTQRHDGVLTTGSTSQPDSSSCPSQPFPDVAHPQPDGSLILVQRVPYTPDDLAVRAAAGVQPTPTGTRAVDQVPDDGARIPVSLTPVDPLAAQPPETPTPTTTGAGSRSWWW
jgi:hypothetical protein